jgi:phosphate starvation-inducible PhoH-like protein
MAKRLARKDSRVATDSSLPKDTSPRVPQRDKLGFPLSIRQRDDLTAKQQELINLILDRDTRVVFLSGPAGTSKTFVSVLAGLMLMEKHSVSDMVYVRSIIESASKSIGALPGEAGDKLEPFLRPLRDKLDEILPKAEVDKLIKDKRAEGLYVGHLRGASFNARFILADEAQNLTGKELLTLVTRVGKFSKLIVAGDPAQSDLNGHSGFRKFCDLFNDEESRQNGVHYFSFTKDDIVRSDLVRFIVGRIEQQEAAKGEPMFPAK